MAMLYQNWRGLIWARTTKGPSNNLTNLLMSSNKEPTMSSHLVWK